MRDSPTLVLYRPLSFLWSRRQVQHRPLFCMYNFLRFRLVPLLNAKLQRACPMSTETPFGGA